MNNDLQSRLLRVMDVGTGDYTPTDGETNRMKIMSSDLVDILEGFLWEFVDKAILLTDTDKYIGFTTPARSTTRIWLRIPKLSPNADNVTLEVYENSSYTGGAAITPQNHERESLHESYISPVNNPTIVTEGDLMVSVFAGGGTGVGQSAAGTTEEPSSEWVLKGETSYLLKIINDSSSSNTIHTSTKFFTE